MCAILFTEDIQIALEGMRLRSGRSDDTATKSGELDIDGRFNTTEVATAFPETFASWFWCTYDEYVVR